jgi:stage V sporulation protein B
MIANFITRILGFFYKVYTVRIIGSEGIGLYEMVFPIYSLLLVITTAGIPVAVSKLISESYAIGNTNNVKKVFYVSVFFLVTSGLISSIIIIWLTPYFAAIIFSDTRVYWPFIATIPAIFIVAVGSAFRGYFQGIQNMLPTSLSQISEQIIRFVVGIYLATYLIKYGIEFSAAGLAIGMVSGELMGLIILLLFFKSSHEITQPSQGYSYSVMKTLKDIYELALPVTFTRVVVSISSAFQAILIPKGLVLAGFTLKEATQIYGQFSGMAFSLINLPTIITVSLAISLVPAISEAAACKNYTLIKKRTNQAFRITILTAIPVAVIFINLPNEIMGIFYNSSEAGSILKVLAFGCPFFYLQHTTGGLLQGLGRVDIIFKNAFISTLIDIILIYWLTPLMGIFGSIIAVILGSLYYSLTNLKWLLKFSRYKLDYTKNIFKPLLAGFIMSLTVKKIYSSTITIMKWNHLAMILFLAIVAYLLSLFLLGVVSNKEFSSILSIKSKK